MNQDLLRLVYVSTAVAPIEQATMQTILERSSTNNALAGITGVLCGGSRHYLQVLEGPDLAVMQLYVRLAADERHRDVVLLSVALVGERMFGQWSMGHVEQQSKTGDLLAPLLALRRLEPGGRQERELLRAFVDQLRHGRTQQRA